MKYKLPLLIIVLTFGLLSFLLFSDSAQALDLGLDTRVKTAAETEAGYGAVTDTTFAEMVGTIIKAVLSLVGVIFTFLLAYAGDMWMMARGNQEQIEKAQKIIIGAILGIVITLAAYAFSNFAVSVLIEKATGSSYPGQDINPDTP